MDGSNYLDVSERRAPTCVNQPVAVRSDRLKILWFLWTLGAVVLRRVVLLVALAGIGAFALIHAAAMLEQFDPQPWFYLSALLWGPMAMGWALGIAVHQRKALWSREGRPPNLEIIAGWHVGGLAMGEEQNFTNTAAVLMVLGGVLAANLAPLALAIEIFEWLATGNWPAIGLTSRMVLPPSIGLFVGGLLLCTEGLTIGDRSLARSATWFSLR